MRVFFSPCGGHHFAFANFSCVATSVVAVVVASVIVAFASVVVAFASVVAFVGTVVVVFASVYRVCVGCFFVICIDILSVVLLCLPRRTVSFVPKRRKLSLPQRNRKEPNTIRMMMSMMMKKELSLTVQQQEMHVSPSRIVQLSD